MKNQEITASDAVNAVNPLLPVLQDETTGQERVWVCFADMPGETVPVFRRSLPFLSDTLTFWRVDGV
jgi:hypothetical protein